MQTIKSKCNTELEKPTCAALEHQDGMRQEASVHADRMTRWLVLMLCALCLSSAFHYMQALNLREASQTITALQKQVFDLQSKASAAVANFRKPLEKGQP